MTPSILAVGLVVGLFYYGEIGRAAPRVVLAIASASWRLRRSRSRGRTRDTSRIGSRGWRARPIPRPRESSAPTSSTGSSRPLGNMGSALSAAEAERARTNAIAAERLRDQATMLAGVVGDSLAQLDEVRLPLHILLESRFGDLNENQEELLRDARTAADAIDVALRRLGQLAEADRGALPVQHELVQINDVVRSVLPLARASAERQGARIEVSLEPGLPRVVADRARLAEALALLASDAAAVSNSQTPLGISTARNGAAAIIRIVPAGKPRAEADGPAVDEGAEPGATAKQALGEKAPSFIVASRLVSAQGGEISVDDGASRYGSAARERLTDAAPETRGSDALSVSSGSPKAR